jgi:hypothetical protein
MSEKDSTRGTVLEKLVSSTGKARHFTFEPPEDRNDLLDPYHPELGLNVSLWQVMLGDLGVLICNHKSGKINKLLIEKPNFVLIFKEFDSLKKHLENEGINATEPVLYWLRGLIHAFMAENPNPVNFSVVMTGMSSTKR